MLGIVKRQEDRKSSNASSPHLWCSDHITSSMSFPCKMWLPSSQQAIYHPTPPVVAFHSFNHVRANHKSTDEEILHCTEVHDRQQTSKGEQGKGDIAQHHSAALHQSTGQAAMGCSKHRHVHIRPTHHATSHHPPAQSTTRGLTPALAMQQPHDHHACHCMHLDRHCSHMPHTREATACSSTPSHTAAHGHHQA